MPGLTGLYRFARCAKLLLKVFQVTSRGFCTENKGSGPASSGHVVGPIEAQGFEASGSFVACGCR